jgi:hypothetical protein
VIPVGTTLYFAAFAVAASTPLEPAVVSTTAAVVSVVDAAAAVDAAVVDSVVDATGVVAAAVVVAFLSLPHAVTITKDKPIAVII